MNLSTNYLQVDLPSRLLLIWKLISLFIRKCTCKIKFVTYLKINLSLSLFVFTFLFSFFLCNFINNFRLISSRHILSSWFILCVQNVLCDTKNMCMIRFLKSSHDVIILTRYQNVREKLPQIFQNIFRFSSKTSR